jgi:hypothetical protein
LIPIWIKTSSPEGQATLAPFSSILCMYLLVRIFVNSRAGFYSVLNYLRRSFSVWISTQ